MTAALKTRPPTGRVPYPLILIEGAEKSGKSYACAEFSASDKIGQTYWIDLGEGSADEYGAIPGARYLVVEHDGTWASLLGQIEAVSTEAARAAAAGEPPVCLVVDSMTAEWDLLKDWASSRARKTDKNKKKLAADPDTEIEVSVNFWNDANKRHRQLMRLLMTFPGIVLVTARGKEVAVIGAGGTPTGEKSYSVEGQKNLPFDASAWIRLSRDAAPLVVGVRSVHAGIRPGVDKPHRNARFSVEWLVFDFLKCVPGDAHTRDLVEPQAEESPEAIRDEALKPSTTVEGLKALWGRAKAGRVLDASVENETGDSECIEDLLKRLAAERAPKVAAAPKPVAA